MYRSKPTKGTSNLQLWLEGFLFSDPGDLERKSLSQIGSLREGQGQQVEELVSEVNPLPGIDRILFAVFN